MQNDINSIYVSFIITDFEPLCPEDITLKLAINPSKIRKKGEKKEGIYRPDAVWEISSWQLDATQSSLDPVLAFEDQINELTEIITSKLEVFKEVCSKCECYFSAGLYLHPKEDTPSVILNKKNIYIMHELGAELNVDIMVIDENEEIER